MPSRKTQISNLYPTSQPAIFPKMETRNHIKQMYISLYIWFYDSVLQFYCSFYSSSYEDFKCKTHDCYILKESSLCI